VLWKRYGLCCLASIYSKYGFLFWIIGFHTPRIYPCRPIFFAQKLMHHPLGHILPTQDSRLYFNRVFYLTYIYVFNIHLRFFDRTGYQNETGKRIVFLLRILRSFRFEKLAVFSECVSYASFHQVSVRRNSQFSLFAPHMHLKEKGVRKHLTP
jgi:hypothetical protein